MGSNPAVPTEKKQIIEGFTVRWALFAVRVGQKWNRTGSSAQVDLKGVHIWTHGLRTTVAFVGVERLVVQIAKATKKRETML